MVIDDNADNLPGMKKEEKQRLEDMIRVRTQALEIELADRKRAEKKLIQSLDKLNRNRLAIMNLMEDLKVEIAEREKVEKQLSLERNILQTLINNIPDLITLKDKEGRYLFTNVAHMRSVGVSTQEEVLGKTAYDIFPEEEAIEYSKDDLSVLKSGKVLLDKTETEIAKDSGEKKWYLTSKIPLTDDGIVTHLLTVSHDITNRVRMDEDLKQKNNELQFLNNLGVELASLVQKEDMSGLLMQRLKEFTGSEFVAYSEYDSETNSLITKKVIADHKVLNKFLKVIGNKVLGSAAPVNLSKENYSEMISEIVAEKMSLTEISFGAIPSIIDKTIRRVTGLDRYYGISYVVSGELFSTSLVGFKADQTSPSKDLLKSFAHIAAISLRRRKAENALTQSEQRYRLLIKNQGEGVGVVDLDEKFILTNPAAEEMFGVEPGGLLNRNLKEFISADFMAIIMEETKKRANAEKSTYEIDIMKPDNKKRTVLITATPDFDENGKHIGTFGVFRDITERKRMEEKIIESEAYHRTLIDVSPDGILTTDMEGIVTYISIKTREIFGIPADVDVLGSSVMTWVSPDYASIVMERVTDILTGNIAPETREYKLIRYDRSLFWGELSSSPLTDKNGKPNGLMVVCRDITDRKKVEADLLQAKDKAEESDRLKTAFLHNISHEIRTPMNAIIGFISLLSEPGIDSENQRSFIDVITQSSNNLLTVVEDIIEVSNIEAGLLKLSKEEINVNTTLNILFEQFNNSARGKNIEFKIDGRLPDTVAKIETDGTKLSRIIANLLSNAFKFTSAGHVRFGYNIKNDWLEFYVSDSGIGIPGDYHKQIFERFFQVENSLARQYEGTGLGLSIAKAYVEFMGGRIWLVSEPKIGSTFYFTIPYNLCGKIERVETKILHSVKTVTNERKILLIAEDEETNFLLLVELLKSLNVEMIHAGNGREAVEVCESGKKISLVLMDIKMPVMDGYAATREIRKILPDLPVIALTAYAYESDREKALSAGCTDYLSKPVSKTKLLETMKKYL